MNPKQPQQQRSRGRNNGGPRNSQNNNNKHINMRVQNFDSNGPDVRVRGNPHQVMDKYLSLGRDASSQGDRVAAENFYQHAEHYLRLINAYNQSQPQPVRRIENNLETQIEREDQPQPQLQNQPLNEAAPVVDIPVAVAEPIPLKPEDEVKLEVAPEPEEVAPAEVKPEVETEGKVAVTKTRVRRPRVQRVTEETSDPEKIRVVAG